ncbi:MAG: YwaF family protein [Oscillospiraceae bacterium]|nr:YwaF family protein [Oscillospiraceae bacterium]
MREFFGFGGYTRPAEGFMSWQHLLFVTCLVAVMTFLGIFLGKRDCRKDEKAKNKVLMVAAIAIDAIELFKIVIVCIRAEDPWLWRFELPLFLCSIQLITIPLAAFAKGRIREAALDFVSIFGILGALLGTYGAGNNYGTYPVLCFDNMVSGITHCISGFAALYIMISGLAGMKKQNMVITYGILIGFCLMAYIANTVLDYNYMFLVRGDGTPYEILFNLVGGHPVLYPASVVALFLVYITFFYRIWYMAREKKTAVAKV